MCEFLTPCIERLAAAPVHGLRFSHDAGKDRGHHLADGASLRRGAPAREARCEWLHVDFEDDLRSFYFDACGFISTNAGLLRL